jgi:hypothetical protein
MKRYWNYFKYLIRHKWFVLIAGRVVGVAWWRLLLHDWTKFLPSEWFPYSRTFYAPDGSKIYQETPAFARAWNAHQKRNKHHWQYWVLLWDRGEITCLEMPAVYWREMLADWLGAGRAIKGVWGAKFWYEANKDKIQLHPKTRQQIEKWFSEEE